MWPLVEEDNNQLNSEGDSSQAASLTLVDSQPAQPSEHPELPLVCLAKPSGASGNEKEYEQMLELSSQLRKNVQEIVKLKRKLAAFPGVLTLSSNNSNVQGEDGHAVGEDGHGAGEDGHGAGEDGTRGGETDMGRARRTRGAGEDGHGGRARTTRGRARTDTGGGEDGHGGRRGRTRGRRRTDTGWDLLIDAVFSEGQRQSGWLKVVDRF
ncbi:hypothetical protein Hamer_G022652, partial [Homarus americanus]